MLACMNAFWVLSAWPASLSPDSLGVIDYIKQGRYFDWHTTTWLLYVKLTTLNANAIWLSIIFQVILMNYLVCELIRFFRPEIKRETTIWFCLLLVSTPWIGANQVTLWKDVTFTIFVLLGMLWIIKATQKKNYSVKGITALTFGSACRHEGWLTLLFALLMVILVLLYNRKAYYTKEKQSLLVSLVIAIVLSAVANNFLASLTNAEKNPREYATENNVVIITKIANLEKSIKTQMNKVTVARMVVIAPLRILIPISLRLSLILFSLSSNSE
jgi:hypothetical protein